MDDDDSAGKPWRFPKITTGLVVVLLLKALFWCFAILLPVTSAWIASSMAAYANGPVWLVALTAFCLFPILPMAWEAFSAHRRLRQKVQKPRILTVGDRMLLRTIALSLGFVVALLTIAPETGVRAILARGDWMLDGRTSNAASTARSTLFRIADGFEWIYRASLERPIEADAEGARPSGKGDGSPQPLPGGESITNDRAGDGSSAQPTPPEPGPGDAATPEPLPSLPAAGEALWPTASTLHPLVNTVPADREASIDVLGRYLSEGEPDPVRRAKAVHDWIADRVAYDMVALRSNHFPSQRAVDVLAARTGVCAGYANLFVELAGAAGLEAALVVGSAKGTAGEVDGRGHAWNAVKLAGQWQLVDVTWDAGAVGPDGEWRKSYRSTYLFAPGDVLLSDHFPEDAKWQLVDPAVSRGDFMRRPQLSPEFFAEGFALTSPTRAQTTVGRVGELVVQNGKGRYMLASYAPKEGGGERERCQVTPGPTIRIACDFAAEGEYRVILFSSPVEFGSYGSVGELQMLSTGG